MKKSIYASLFTFLLISVHASSAWAVTYTAKAGSWTAAIWLSSATNAYVALSQVTLATNDQLIIDPGANQQVSITGNITIVPKVNITVKAGTLFFNRPVQLTLVDLSSVLTVNAGAFTNADDSGNNILLTFGTNSDYNGGDFRGQGNQPRSGPVVFVESGNDVGGLPVTLLSFKAMLEKETSQVKLTWITATEKNNAYFTVERSKDGASFETLAKVQGSGNSSQVHTYAAIDDVPLAGVSYYRLRQTDLDGRSETFKMASVMNVRPTAFAVFPNPASSDGFSISVSESTQEATLLIYNYKGEKVFDQRIRSQGRASFRVEPSLRTGIYWVQLMEADKVSVKKLVVVGGYK